MIVAGVMSGTSADGIDVAIVRVLGRGFRTRFELLHHSAVPFPPRVRRAVLDVMNARASVADLSRLSFLLGDLYAEAIGAAAKKVHLQLDLIGCHGQTIYHQGTARAFLGRDIACTWQIGEGAVIAARTGVPVVSDFRPADMAAGGTGAPLVPFLDYLLYRHRRRGRIVQNIGGIANFTAIPAKASPEQVIAFDTGPGNMVIDGITERLFGKPFDRDGRIAARGRVLDVVVSDLLRRAFFRRRPPKTAGREEFGREFVAEFLRRCRRARKEDVVATATALTAYSIADAVRAFVAPAGEKGFREMTVSGGGAKNRTLMSMLRDELPDLKIRTSDEFGLPSEAKEAVAFAVLAYQTWRRVPSNIPAATGAERAAVLGKISYPYIHG
ncbi:MAG: anhydro-N-acetylmuramic acid kinase [Acidobacteriia bacterium]|nr:anhydro-N-acetylmuramic acid kinase [Terriglobia bacterium]